MSSQLAYLKDVVTLRLDREKCIGCGACLLVCPHAVLSLTNGKIAIADRDACMECGACSKKLSCRSTQRKVGSGLRNCRDQLHARKEENLLLFHWTFVWRYEQFRVL